MELLIAGLLIFFGVHLVPNIGDTRARLLERFGEKGYMPVYAVLSLVGIVLIVLGKSRAEFVGLWIPPAWGKSVALVIMTLSVFFFVSIFIPNNLTRKVHHPMLAFVAVWGVSHLLSNGDLSALLLFGGFTGFSVFKMVSLTRRKPPEPKPPVSMIRDFIAVALAAVVYGGVIYFHDTIAGVSLV